MKYYLYLIILSLLVTSCKSTKKLVRTDEAKELETANQAETLSDLVLGSEVFNKIFTGFVLFDPVEQKTLFEKYPDHYFTPASNVKILTLYTALEVLGDSIPALKYYVSNDSLFFWGTGDPSLLNSKIDGNTRSVIDFLKNRKEKLFYVPQYLSGKFGSGWAWDDYKYAFSTQKHAMPVYGNLIKLVKRKGQRPITIPSYFEQFLQKSSFSYDGGNRNEQDNGIIYSYSSLSQSSYSKSIPMHMTNAVVLNILKVETGKTIQLHQNNLKFFKPRAKTIYSVPTDEVLKKMMLPSDNFLAEQLLYVCASALGLRFRTSSMIDHAKKNIFKNMPSQLTWRDGSGLSRYNLLTPRSMVTILDKMYQEYDIERILTLFPTGGKSGTLRNWYKGNPPYIFAKTGTMSNKHCLSGYIKTKEGKTLIFSFMHNNYIGSSSQVKREMEKVFKFIRDGGDLQ